MIDSARFPQFLDRPVFRLVSDAAGQLGVRAFVIGGYVRDCFLGRSNDDIDIVVEGSGIALARQLASLIDAKQGHHCNVSVFKNFGTAMLHFDGTEIEFVGARKESYQRNSRKPVVEDGSLEDDQLRRDFTINAMAFSLQSEDFGALVDPFGGIRDLDKGIIRTPLDPEITYSDDPLRMLRAIRFACKLSTVERRFEIVPESLEAMRRMRGRMAILSKERIAEELNKILLSPKPSMGFRLMDSTGLLEYVLPDLLALKGVETKEGKGHKDNFEHTITVVDHVAEVSDKLWLRWAALLHDIGKPASKRWDPQAGWTFHGHEIIGSRMVPAIFRELKMPMNEKMKYVAKLVCLHHRPVALVDEGVTDSAVRRLLFDAGEDIDDLMILCNADITSKKPEKVARLKKNFEHVKEKMEEVEARDAIRNWKNPITGEYIMQVYGIGPCKEIGVIKEAVKEAVLDGRVANTFEATDALMREVASGLGLVAKN